VGFPAPAAPSAGATCNCAIVQLPNIVVKRPKKSKPVGVLSKTFRILELLQGSTEPLNLTEIGERAAINKSTALRILAHLESVKYVTRNDKGEYSPGGSALPVGGSADWRETLRRISRPHLWELWRDTRETVNLGVLEGVDVVYLDCLESAHEFRLVAHIGMRAVLYRTALGKAILAFYPQGRRDALIDSLEFEAFTPRTLASAGALRLELERVRQQGHAIDDEESHIGLRCIAAPILNARHQALAAISVSAPVGRLAVENIGAVAATVRQAGLRISACLASSGLD